ncbi:putative peroxiredoxin bcp [Cellvibrio zantedeschiae]|uniref:thioredoxin-dependent peroxiredoxin n=1 Tax=Cellvibrio zantedeschiae TaxID=1237077 RepID=A0ABQ3AXN0_9GAMM|nr:thioredoxin-dependent thiol peroxidase [Cellvibrio zantedeschiae]GGY70473.1 putative peroxiredoxin bcp [Cellvibrio zantedeschiae]
MAFPKIGNIAPDFSLLNQSNEIIQLKDFKGKSNVLVYFYPKAATPGCTVQACGIRDYAAEFKKLNTRVFAISPDSPAKLQKFATKYDLEFDLLSDEDHAVADAYGVWGLKKFMGREFMGIIRTSFIIDQSGRLVKILEKVNTKTHNDDVIDYIKTLP